MNSMSMIWFAAGAWTTIGAGALGRWHDKRKRNNRV